MKHAIRPAVLSAVIVALAALSAPHVLAQGAAPGYSEHGKTVPSDPPAAAPQPAATPEESATAPEDQSGQAANATPEEAEPGGQPGGGEQANAPKESNPFGVTDGWDAQFGTSPPQSSDYSGTSEQFEIIEKINAYFNEMTNLEGRFLQTNADDTRKKGKFFLERPGKVRFDYSRPSREKIISDGEYLAIENHDLNTTDRYPLDSTPFRLLLKDRVNLAEDARIVALDVGIDIVVLTVEDRESSGGGQIRLFFDWPEVQLREWIITDAQGLNTRIELAELEADKAVDPKLFKFSPGLGLPSIRGR